MKVIILAAGYATRLYPKTLNMPKGLLEYKGKKILDYLLDDLDHKSIDEIILVSNHKFYLDFFKYCKTRKENIKVLDNGSTEPSNRRGAGNDLIYALNSLNIDDDILVLASDNILSFSLSEFINFYAIDNKSSIMYYDEESEEKLKITGQAMLYRDKVVVFKEKPISKISNNAIPPFYIFNRYDISYLKELNGSYDSLGLIIEDLASKIVIKAFKMPGLRLDLGNNK